MEYRKTPGPLPALLVVLILVASTATPLQAQEAPALVAVNPSIFPTAAPEEVGMSSARLREAMATIEGWVEERRILGAILIVVRHGRLVFHEATGWNDRERGVPMGRDDILLMRSMTKPMTGTGVLVLVEEGKLSLEDPASRYLPGWDGEGSREITIFQLLTHTSGMDGEVATGHPSLLEAVAERGRGGPRFPPGTRYRYADVNSAALAAIIQVVSGMPGDRFLQERILEPLGMRDSFLYDAPEGDPRHARVASGYRGNSQTGEWNRYREGTGARRLGWWGGSGGLYGTGLDYARFLEAFHRGGSLHGHQLLSPGTVKQGLEPQSTYVYNGSDLMAMTRLYGLHWYTWTDLRGVNPWPMSPGSFGHGGAEGTFAWVDPTRGLLVLYLTQSNGNDTRPHVPRMIYGAIEEGGGR